MHNHERRNGVLFNLAICLGFVIVQLDVSVVNVGLNALSTAYNAHIADLEWVINSYSLMFAALLLSSGSVSDRFGAKNIFLLGVLIFIIASLCCALAPTLIVLEAARTVQGIGAAFLVPTSLTLLSHYYTEPHARTLAISFWAASGSMALAAGPIAGGLLIQYLGWRSIFLLNIPVGLVSLLIASRFAPATKKQDQPLNLPGQLLIILALGLTTFALTESGRKGWDNAMNLCVLLAGCLAFTAFCVRERISNTPVIPGGIRTNRFIIISAVIGFLCTLVFYGAVFILSLYFQQAMKMSPSQTGFAFLPMMLSVALATYNAGRLGKHFGVRNVVIAGGISCFAGFGWLSVVEADWTIWQLLMPMILLGVGTSLAVPGLAGLIFSEASFQNAGAASAFFSCSRQMGGVVGIAVFGTIFSGATSLAFMGALRVVCYVALALIVTWLVLGQKCLPAK